ncbi:serine protease SP24D-like [Belonocnema kinseyi]|uniref:serine protease SP24D-like n=1 Tax=Belonocnema kinseyi TaxID=2817044 RepID=UPI00143D6856|nr:serine protease SP24D-like [Belonocnema kinseyi]
MGQGAVIEPGLKIIGGSVAFPGEFPHAVSLRISGQHFCGGSIVDPQHIVTAAHCVQGAILWYLMKSALTVVSGSNSLSRGGNSHKIKRIAPHPDFKFDVKKYFPNDIAVITLMSPMVFNRYQKPIKLPSEDSYQGMKGIILGWGRSFPDGKVSEYLQKLYPTVQDISYCGSKLFTNIPLQRGLVCVVLPKGKGACNGDSGGSLIVNNELIGVASFIIPKCASGYPDFYTKVFAYLSFIEAEMLQTYWSGEFTRTSDPLECPYIPKNLTVDPGSLRKGKSLILWTKLMGFSSVILAVDPKSSREQHDPPKHRSINSMEPPPYRVPLPYPAAPSLSYISR